MRFKEFFSLPSLSSKQRPLLGLLTALLFVTLVAGCGSSSGGSFVATPGDGGNTNVGTSRVTFNFVKAQSAITVPNSTVNLRFEFFTGTEGSGSLVLRENRPFAASVTFENIPVTVNSAVVTAIDSNGFPVQQFKAELNLAADQAVAINAANGVTSAVTLDDLSANPAALSLGLEGSVKLNISAVFSNKDSVVLSGELLTDEVLFSSNDTSTAAVAGDGTVSAVLAGETFVTATFRGKTVTVPVTVSTGNAIPPLAQSLTVAPASVSLPVGAVSPKLEFTVTFPGGITRKVGSAQGVVLSSSAAGITLNANDQIVIGGSVEPGTIATVTGTYAGLRARVQVTVEDATLNSISVAPANVSLPFGGFEQKLVASGSYSNGSTVELDPSTLTFAESSALFSVNADGLLVTAASGTSGTGTVTVSHKTAQVNSVSANITVGAVTVNSLLVERDGEQVGSLTLTSGEFADVVIKAELSNGNIVDVSGFAVLQRTLTGTGVVLNGGRVVGVTPGTTSTVKYTLPGSGLEGATVSTELVVTVEAVTLVSVEYHFAGNPIADSAQTVNLPRGYVGVFEVYGTFSNGAVRKLRASEYTLKKNGGARNPGAIQLLNSSYKLRQPDAHYFDGKPAPGTGGGGADDDFTTNDAVVDDFLTSTFTGTPARIPVLRTMDTSKDSSNDRSFAVKETFRAVVADWYIGRYDSAPFSEPNTFQHAPDSSARIVISVTGYPDFDRQITVTVIDPEGPPTVSTPEFANSPGDPNIPVGTPRELVVRVEFPRSAPPVSLPPDVGPLKNFKLAEANISFSTDDLPDATDQPEPSYRQVIHHRVTELGFIGVTSDVPYDVGLISVAASPIGGAVAAPLLVKAPSLDPASGNYVPGEYESDLRVFGESSGLTSVEDPFYSIPRDPGPVTFVDRPEGQPDDQLRRTYTMFDNGGAGFRVVEPVYFSIEPSNSGLVLEVGQNQIFQTVAQWSANEEVKDVSKDYPPQLPAAETNVVGFPEREEDGSSTGHLTVSGVKAGTTATVTAFDVAGAPITPYGTGSRNNTVINVVAPTAP